MAGSSRDAEEICGYDDWASSRWASSVELVINVVDAMDGS